MRLPGPWDAGGSRRGPPDAPALLPRNDRGRLSPKEVETAVRAYEVMVILDPSLDERTVAPSLDTYLNVVRQDGGEIESVDVWGKRRLAYEINKNAEGIYAVIDLKAEPATVKELDRQLTLNESVLRTKVLRPGASCSVDPSYDHRSRRIFHAW